VRVTVRDDRTERTLAASTATLVRAQVPVECILRPAIDECLTQRAETAQGDLGAQGAQSAPSAPARQR
jgi:hypothetical protein